MMLFSSHVNLIIFFTSVFTSSVLVQADSYADDSAADYEAEDVPPDDHQLIPPNGLILTRLLQNQYPSVATENDIRPAESQNSRLFSKRSRYYRKYPGKRQNRHYSDLYDCNPSSSETVRLLYAIHQARLGDIEHIVFCNRLRNPKGIIPNPRYVGKRSFT